MGKFAFWRFSFFLILNSATFGSDKIFKLFRFVFCCRSNLTKSARVTSPGYDENSKNRLPNMNSRSTACEQNRTRPCKNCRTKWTPWRSRNLSKLLKRLVTRWNPTQTLLGLVTQSFNCCDESRPSRDDPKESLQKKTCQTLPVINVERKLKM